MTKTLVARVHQAGEPEVIKLEEASLADPGPGEVTIRHTAIGLNFQDIYMRSGLYPGQTPFGLGNEAAGVVEKVGAGVADFKEGDRVCYASGPVFEAYSTRRNFPAARLLHTPAGIQDEQAAAILLKGMTVEYLMHRCFPVKAGMSVLFHAAAGGVGLLAGQWGKDLGARMIGVAGGPEKCALALQNGYEACLDRKKDDIAARTKELTGGKGVPVVFDSVGKDSFDASLNSLAPRGFFVSFGQTTGHPPPVTGAMLQKLGSLYFTRPTLATYTADTQEMRESAAMVFDRLKRGVLKLSINQRYALSDVVRAHRDLQAGATSGSTIITP
ncbi:MAG: Quinone oxidoreductase 1 [Pseudomonadota bacterium]|jgi:NADPH2:quinone reductase